MSDRGTSDTRRTSRGALAWLGLVPFAVYITAFLIVPTVLALASGFRGADGDFTLDNIRAIAEPAVAGAIWSSVWLSGVTAVLGAVIGALVCWALTGARDGVLRRAVDALCGTLAQMGGVMLAFAFIATLGAQGFVTIVLRDQLGIDIYASGVWLYQVPGLILPYLFFQVPLMIITFLPAFEGLKNEWAEANAVLGGTAFDYWRRVGGPVLTPAFLGGLVLLFANSFSSFATAAALISQGSQLVTLQIRAAIVSETLLGRENMAGALSLAMVVIVTALMWTYFLLDRRTARWQR